MDGVPADAIHVWMALALASAAFFGIALGSPSTPPPDAAAVAATVNAVAASPHAGSGTHPVQADEIRLDSHRLALRNAGGAAHATLLVAVVPVPPGGPLAAVLRGAPVRRIFATPAAFRRTADRARNRTIDWRPAGDRVLVRHVTWEGIDVTLVGA